MSSTNDGGDLRQGRVEATAAVATSDYGRKVLETLAATKEATVDEVATAAGIGRTSARKYLVDLDRSEMAKRVSGGRDGKRRLPDRFAHIVADDKTAAKPRAKTSASGRLSPGGLDELVIAYMADHPDDTPFGPTAVARGLGRSTGAVGNCLGRLAEAGIRVTQVGERPRRYALRAKEN